jgi:hypothetical protein
LRQAKKVGLTKLSDDEAASVRDFIAAVRKEAEELLEIAAEPNEAARVRLYARVATWIREHPGLHDENSCAICGHILIDGVNELTGLKIKDHINGAAKEGDYAGQTFAAWANHVIGQITTRLSVAIAAEVRRDLSESPASLLRQAMQVFVNQKMIPEEFSGTFRRMSPAAFDTLMKMICLSAG